MECLIHSPAFNTVQMAWVAGVGATMCGEGAARGVSAGAGRARGTEMPPFLSGSVCFQRGPSGAQQMRHDQVGQSPIWTVPSVGSPLQKQLTPVMPEWYFRIPTSQAFVLTRRC